MAWYRGPGNELSALNILSIQSQVVYGHVGNSAAQFILQRLGHEVWAVPTTLFSSHLAKPSWTGKLVPQADIAALLDGLADLGVLDRVDAVMTGYLGESGNVAVIADLIDRLHRQRPHLIYACDPVMGDNGKLYVTPALADAIAAKLVGRADILLPNQFELQRLSGIGPVCWTARCRTRSRLWRRQRPASGRPVANGQTSRPLAPATVSRPCCWGIICASAICRNH